MRSVVFRGIVEQTAVVAAVEEMPGSVLHRIRLALDAPLDIQKGEAMAVNGVCITVRQVEALAIEAVIWQDTWKLTNFSQLSVGDRVNIELPVQDGYEDIFQCER